MYKNKSENCRIQYNRLFRKFNIAETTRNVITQFKVNLRNIKNTVDNLSDTGKQIYKFSTSY